MMAKIQVLVPVVPHKSLNRVHAPYTPAAARQVPGAPVPEVYSAPGFDSTFAYRRVIEGFAFARLPGPYLPGDLSPDFDSNAHHRGF